MAQDQDDFLRRWSRRKLQEAARPPEPKRAESKPAAAGEAPPLPAIDSLTFESDFKAFMHAKVEDSVKRAALKKLFADPRFNVIDFMDVYIDDYTKDDPIPAAMMARLQHSRTTLFGREEEKKKDETREEPKPEELAQAPGPAEEQPKEQKQEDDGAAG
ncbi:MAG: DUF3306 domain-containing protein [Betaproteobacteria bacterium]|nr:DUF3306 domain-containing protein [Betaproteobacteria bacterium]